MRYNFDAYGKNSDFAFLKIVVIKLNGAEYFFREKIGGTVCVAKMVRIICMCSGVGFNVCCCIIRGF